MQTRRAGRRAALGALILVLLALAAAGWITLRGLAAQHRLANGRTELAVARQALGQSDPVAARRSLARAQADTGAAATMTSDIVWRLAGAVPVLGRGPHAVTTAADVADAVTTDILPPLVSAADQADLTKLRTSGGVALQPLVKAEPLLVRAGNRTLHERRRLDGLPGPYPGTVRRGVTRLRHQLDELSQQIRAAGTIAGLLPPMLGADGTRRYLVVIQNPAEARGTGGLLGAYGVLVAKDGRLRLRQIGPNGDLDDAPRVPVDLGTDFTSLYGQDPAIWKNANESPYFPYAARIWLALWARQHHERLDGVVATDPVALQFFVRAVGPMKLSDGPRLTRRSTADFVMQGVYARFPLSSQTRQRDRLLTDIGARVVDRLLGSAGSPRAVVSAIRDSIDDGRVQLFSAHAAEETRLLESKVGGDLTDRQGPFLAVVVNNGGGNKMDFYLRRDVSWRLGPCSGGTRDSDVRVRLTNTAPRTGLPPYAVGRPFTSVGGLPAPPGTNRVLLNVFTTRGSTVTGATLGGEPTALRGGRELGLTVSGLTVDLRPGASTEVELHLAEPVLPGVPHVHLQPLARPQRTTVSDESCAR